MRILFCGYRKWAIRTYNILGRIFDFASSPQELEEKTSKVDYDMIFFVGWSWIVEQCLIQNSKCICMHPSPLPKYRGGSPIQNQIINGEKESAVTFFLMDEKMDHGKILWQQKLSLEGDLASIFSDISLLTKDGILHILDNPKYEGIEQDHSQATIYKRRKPKDSEIKPEDFYASTAEELYNKIRCLQGPYPKPFIECKDGTILYITGAKCD
tara:strand:- start:2390 stop:3025 length:636 start_codon:yes stop_codon:yes gene_type:complete